MSGWSRWLEIQRALTLNYNMKRLDDTNNMCHPKMATQTYSDSRPGAAAAARRFSPSPLKRFSRQWRQRPGRTYDALHNQAHWYVQTHLMAYIYPLVAPHLGRLWIQLTNRGTSQGARPVR